MQGASWLRDISARVMEAANAATAGSPEARAASELERDPAMTRSEALANSVTSRLRLFAAASAPNLLASSAPAAPGAASGPRQMLVRRRSCEGAAPCSAWAVR